MTSTDNRPHVLANRAYYETMPTRRVRILVEIEADVEWRDESPDYCEGVARVETVDGDGGRSKNWSRRILDVTVQ